MYDLELTMLNVFKFDGNIRSKWRKWKIKTIVLAKKKDFIDASPIH